MSELAGPRRVAISGASGLVGAALVPHLAARGDGVVRLVRRAAAQPDEISWDPAAGALDRTALDGVDAVVHLAGAGIADRRWTAARRALIRASRVDGTRLVAEAIAALPRPPRVLVVASAIGIYGDRGDELLDESSAPGTGFLAKVVAAWEAASAPAVAAGVRVVNLRFGVILSADGGALPRLVRPFRWGLGGRIGDGRQWLSWIASDDVVAAIAHALDDDGLAGPANTVAPNPVQNRELAATLGRVLRRPAVVPVPRFAIATAFGAMGRETILASARVAPRRLTDRGFGFAFPTLEPALRHLLDLPEGP